MADTVYKQSWFVTSKAVTSKAGCGHDIDSTLCKLHVGLSAQHQQRLSPEQIKRADKTTQATQAQATGKASSVCVNSLSFVRVRCILLARAYAAYCWLVRTLPTPGSCVYAAYVPSPPLPSEPVPR